MLATIREFGREQLAMDGEYQVVRSRHAAYYAALVDETAAAWESPAEQTAAQQLEREFIEIRVALRHFLETGDAASGRRMVTKAGPFWLGQGHVAEGRQWIDAFLASETPECIPLPERARALMLRARLAMDELGTEDPAARSVIRTQLEEARALARSIDDEQLELEALVHLTQILANDHDVERSLALAEEGIALAEQSNRWRLAELYLHTSLLAHWTGDRERATALAVGAGALADELGNERLSIEARLTLSLTAPPTSLVHGVRPLADYVSRAEMLGDQRILSWLYPAVASEALDAGRVTDAARWFRASLEMDRDSGYWHRGAFGMVGAQGLASMRGHLEEVARLHGALSLHLDALRRAAPPDYVRDWEDFVAAIRDSMGHDAFDAAMRDGTARSWDEAVAEAVAICDREIDEPSATQEPRSRPHAAYDLELTARELDVLRLIAVGGTNKDVAAALGIRPKTVMHHSMAIYRKLGVRGRAEASAYAYRNNLVPE
jgi:DNA-binding CsgD family transcriptional regulator